MAFTTSSITTTPIAASLRVITGIWSGAAGDAAGSFTFGGALIGSLWFDNDANTQSNQIFPAVSASTTGNSTTLTVQNQDNITNGTFIIFAGGN